MYVIYVRSLIGIDIFERFVLFGYMCFFVLESVFDCSSYLNCLYLLFEFFENYLKSQLKNLLESEYNKKLLADDFLILIIRKNLENLWSIEYIITKL